MTDSSGATPAIRQIAYFGFAGLIDSNNASRIAAAINAAANQGANGIYLCMSSHGGTVADGVYLYHHLRAMQIEITAHNIGSVSSIAVAIYVGATTRYCSPHSNFLIHPTTMGPFSEPVPWMRLDAALKTALAEDQRIENILRERASIPDRILNDRRFRDINISSAEAVEFGLANEVRDFSLPKGEKMIQI